MYDYKPEDINMQNYFKYLTKLIETIDKMPFETFQQLGGTVDLHTTLLNLRDLYILKSQL